MKRKPCPPVTPAVLLPRLPDWVAGLDASRSENALLAAGSALTALHLAIQVAELPQALWRARLALVASETCARLEGRRESMAQMRDEVHLLRPDELPGPAGTIALSWLRATERPVNAATLQRALPNLDAIQIKGWFAPEAATPLAGAVQVLQAVRADLPRNSTAALILADASIAGALGWPHILPLLGQELQRRDLAAGEAELQQACARAIVKGARTALTQGAELTRKARTLRAVRPRLRAKGADRAVAMFLAQDALAPQRALVPMMSDRAARRLCERLVELGAVREITGRESFRLYGV